MLTINKVLWVVFFMLVNNSLLTIFTFNIDGDDEANIIEYTVDSQNKTFSNFFGYSTAFYKKFEEAR